MNQLKLPCLYHPTTTIFVDDNRRFLEGIKISSKYDTNCILFDNPEKALEFVLSSAQTAMTIKKTLTMTPESMGFDSAEQNNIDTQSIYTASYNASRFQEISTIVIDYAMPSMNGLEICKMLEHTHVKKIMLTGEADETLAVEAFNAGIIDMFLRKTSTNFTAQLHEAMHNMQEEYFKDISQLIIGRQINSGIASHMYDNAFSAFFRALLQNKRILEFYICGQLNNFMLLNNNSIVSILLTRKRGDLNKYIIAGKEDKAPKKIIHMLENIEAIPFFGIEDHFWEAPTAQWGNFMFPAIKIDQSNDRYYALLEEPAILSKLSNKILFYDQFKKKTT